MNPALETLILAFREIHSPKISTLFFGAEPHDELLHAKYWQALKPLAARCDAAGMQKQENSSESFPLIFFLPGKTKSETLAGFARAYDLLADGGMLITSLSNTSGAARYERELNRLSPVQFSLSKHKCRAFAVKKTGEYDEELLKSWRKLSELSLIPDTAFTVQPGIFSADAIDHGSALLADYLPSSLRGEVADLGAGWGYLSSIAFQKCPKIDRIDLYEADSRALDCARLNVTGNAQFFWHDVTQGIPQTYDVILTNPPFHTGQSKDLDLGKAFLSVAAQSLKRGGTLYLVANRQLPYEAHLKSLGLSSRVALENQQFKILVAKL